MVSERSMERAIAWAARFVPSVDVSTEGLEAFAAELDEQHVRSLAYPIGLLRKRYGDERGNPGLVEAVGVLTRIRDGEPC